MSMSTHIVGFRPPDKKWNKMKEIWIACESEDVPIPEEVSAFFDHEPPGDRPGSEVDIGKSIRKWSDDSRQGFEVELAKLPPDVKVLRFYNAW